LIEGRVEHLKSALMHGNLKGLAAFVDRHNQYSDLEAAELVNPSAGRASGSFVGSWEDRRRALKQTVWFRLPFRPLIRFVWLFVVKRGFLDGRRGLLFCSLIAMYDLLINAKVMEQRLGGGAHERAPVLALHADHEEHHADHEEHAGKLFAVGERECS
jgi:hypothetical protein